MLVLRNSLTRKILVHVTYLREQISLEGKFLSLGETMSPFTLLFSLR